MTSPELLARLNAAHEAVTSALKLRDGVVAEMREALPFKIGDVTEAHEGPMQVRHIIFKPEDGYLKHHWMITGPAVRKDGSVGTKMRCRFIYLDGNK